MKNKMNTMEKKQKPLNTLQRLEMLRNTLNEYRRDSTGEERQNYSFLLDRVCNMLADEQRRLKFMAVYPIVNGCSTEAIFEGTREQCNIFASTYKEKNPEHYLIITQI